MRTSAEGERQAGESKRPALSLSLDLDNLWSYLKTRGDSRWESLPSYLDPLTDVVLAALERRGLEITFFIVGQDAALERNREALGRIAAAGHEIANHSFHHEPWLHRYSPEELDEELSRAEEAIAAATGTRTRGFRGPGYSLSQELLRVLARRGYEYDASTLPTFIGPLARAYYFRRNRDLPAEERRERARLFGTFRDGLRPLKPYCWNLGDPPLIEIPVTTMPGPRAPFHLSYLLYLAGYARGLGLSYLRLALAACRLARVEPSFLLHPLDFLGGDRVSELGFFPGMSLDTSFKLGFFDQALDIIEARFEVITMGEHARRVRGRPQTALVELEAMGLP